MSRYTLMLISIVFCLIGTSERVVACDTEWNNPSDSILSINIHSKLDIRYFYGDSPEQYQLDLRKCKNVTEVYVFIGNDFNRLNYPKSHLERFDVDMKISSWDLKVLNLKLQVLFDNIGKINTLRKIEIEVENEEVIELSEDLFKKCNHFTDLKILSYGLKKLPESFVLLTELKNLALQCPRLKEEFKLGQLKKIERLGIYSNFLSTIDNGIGNGEKLVELDLSLDNLKSIPSQIGNLKQMESIFLGSKKLKVLPEELGSLIGLKGIVFITPKLRKLPTEMSNLTQLQSCEIYSNKLDEQQKILEGLPNLDKLIIGTAKQN